jgi:hypothetical protein
MTATTSGAAKPPAKAPAEAETKANFIALARLRRELLVLASGEAPELAEIAKQAVRQGRAAEVFLIPVAAYFSESELDLLPEGEASPEGTPESPKLNPGA